MRLIDADELIESCKRQIQYLEDYSKESGLDTSNVRRTYSLTIDLLRSADTVNAVTRHEYDRMVSDYEQTISDMKDIVELNHVEYDDAQMGREK